MKVKITGALVLVSVLTAAWLASHGYTTFATPFCAEGATNVTTAAQVESTVAAGEDVCVTAAISEQVTLESLTSVTTAEGAGDLTASSVTVSNVTTDTGTFAVGMRLVGAGVGDGARITEVGAGTLTLSKQATATDTSVAIEAADDRQIGTSGAGSLGYIEMDTVAWVTLNARFRSTRIDAGDRVMLDNSIVGGTEAERPLDQLIFMPSTSSDALISNSDIGWANADNGGNSGYGIRAYGDNDRLCICGNKIHDVAGDGIQGVGGDDVRIDRNEIGPVAPNPESDEHSDTIQITGNDANLRITNNWIHDQGFYQGEPTGNSGNIYVHGGSNGTVLIENNLFEHSLGRFEACGLGTGGSSRSNITIRNNTVRTQGLAFDDFPGFEWDCDAGTGNTIERNVAVDPDGGFLDHGFATYTGADNLFGLEALVTFDDDGNCTSANCNPEGDDAIGYRKPTGVNW